MPQPKSKKVSSERDFHLQNIDEIIKLEQRDRTALSLSDKIASKITEFSGSMLYVSLHVLWFGLWILINTGMLGFKPFDPFPFNLLTMTVSLEAIFLSSFVLISQNRQATQADKRAKIDLQINMIAERETTKIIEMLLDLHQHLGMKKKNDKEIKILKKTTDVNKLATEIDKAEERKEKNKGKSPESAADTSK